MLDAQAKQEYRRRLAELREELEELKERGDHARAAKVEGEIDFLAREIARAVGLGGRDRRAGAAQRHPRHQSGVAKDLRVQRPAWRAAQQVN
jgi:hypothetical protein